MNSQAIKAVADALSLFIAELKKESRPPAKLTIPDKEWKVLTAGTHFVYFRRKETIDALAAFRKKFCARREWRDKWSEKYLDRAERKLVGQALEEPSESAILAATKIAAGHLEEDAPEFTVVLPIARLYLGKMRLKFPGIQLHTITAAHQRRIRTAFFKIIETTPHTDSEKKKLRGDVIEMTTLLLNRPCAEVTVRADPDRAEAEAERQVSPILDFLQLLSAIYDPPVRGIKIRVGGDLLTKQPMRFIMATDESSIHTRDKFLFDFRFELTKERLANMKGDGFGALFDAMLKPVEKQTEFERRLLTSMHWIADASRQDLLENKITSYITSIETFFSSDGSGNPLSRDLSEGSATILASAPKERLRRRVDLAETVGRLYKLRNAISHAGQRVEDENAERELREISINLLALIGKMSRKFQTLKDFREWLRERRLS
jgi:hypothetical protein